MDDMIAVIRLFTKLRLKLSGRKSVSRGYGLVGAPEAEQQHAPAGPKWRDLGYFRKQQLMKNFHFKKKNEE
jgi:hypothetical protein